MEAMRRTAESMARRRGRLIWPDTSRPTPLTTNPMPTKTTSTSCGRRSGISELRCNPARSGVKAIKRYAARGGWRETATITTRAAAPATSSGIGTTAPAEQSHNR